MRKVISQQMQGKYITLFLLISILATSGAVLTQAITASACFAMIGVTLAIIAGYLVTVHYDHLTIKTIMDTLRKINQKQVQSPEPNGETVTEKNDEFVEKNLKNNKKFS